MNIPHLDHYQLLALGKIRYLLRLYLERKNIIKGWQSKIKLTKPMCNARYI